MRRRPARAEYGPGDRGRRRRGPASRPTSLPMTRQPGPGPERRGAQHRRRHRPESAPCVHRQDQGSNGFHSVLRTAQRHSLGPQRELADAPGQAVRTRRRVTRFSSWQHRSYSIAGRTVIEESTDNRRGTTTPYKGRRSYSASAPSWKAATDHRARLRSPGPGRERRTRFNALLGQVEAHRWLLDLLNHEHADQRKTAVCPAEHPSSCRAPSVPLTSGKAGKRWAMAGKGTTAENKA
jgi:hypothetical protein